eukprot:gnl/Spiro4/29702_TR14583_c0_g1_i1.p1 gnl/Spiro4/29702_TR14583_c0_g1~~gnl/Spiro4/29702_TR14583_c0_g1_i1.p1  ORF type:complete len:166 (+),score=21.35 gnl/Spiro4/29702_TR14583_c0_g1_i1:39-500(+)
MSTSLPDELVEGVIAYLANSVQDLSRCGAVCRAWRRICAPILRDRRRSFYAQLDLSGMLWTPQEETPEPPPRGFAWGEDGELHPDPPLIPDPAVWHPGKIASWTFCWIHVDYPLFLSANGLNSPYHYENSRWSCCGGHVFSPGCEPFPLPPLD